MATSLEIARRGGFKKIICNSTFKSASKNFRVHKLLSPLIRI